MNILKENKAPDVFEFGIDETGKAYLLQTARWTKFLAVMGFLFTGLMFLLALFFMVTPFRNAVAAGVPGMQAMLLGVYIFLGLLYLYPTIELFQFSSNIKAAMASGNVARFNLAMKNQRNMFRFMGILVIALLVLYGVFIIGLLALNASDLRSALHS